jgi:hypothetical protein
VSPDQTCAVCGRTILAGERVRSYMSPRDGPQLVCELCRTRAERLGWVDPAARGANVGRRQGPEAGDPPGDRLDRAIARFNSSEAARTTAGLIRTLGQPSVSIGSAAGSPGEVRVTVAWELCWYQWGVDLADDGRAVFQIDKGRELDQLDRSARQWNGSAGADGSLSLGASAPGHPRNGEPVG